MTYATSEDIFLGRKQEDFDLAEKLLVKHGKLSIKCVREMTDAVYDRMGIAECYKILQRVWNDMHVSKLEDENAKLREALCAAWKCANAGISCSDCRLIAGGCTLQSAMCELGIEVDG